MSTNPKIGLYAEYAKLNPDDLIWQKSPFSGAQGNCVEVAKVVMGHDGDTTAYAMRDSKDVDAGTLLFTGDEWRAFVAGARAGEFDTVALPNNRR